MSESFLNSQVPNGDIRTLWQDYKSKMSLVAPNNKPKYTIIVVGTGLAGASAASSLAELGYQVKSFCIQDSPRRAHSIAAQGGINAAKNYQNDGDSIYRLFYDTIKGGDFRSREANVYRLAALSVNIIDQAVAQGVPFAREYGGYLDNRSFGGAQVKRTFYARGQTGQQLLLGAYSALCRQIDKGCVQLFPRHEMLDLVVVKNKARGIITRNLVTGKLESHKADAVLLATGGYGNVFYLSTNAKASNVTASFRAYKRGAFFANPCFTQIHPTCIPVSGDYQSKLTLMSESLRNDGRVWVPKKPNDNRSPRSIPKSERDYYLERRYPSFGNLVPRDVASRAAKKACDEGFGVGSTKLAVYLDFQQAIEQSGRNTIASRYGNLFHMYEKITGDNPYEIPMRIYPATHYTMGGLWVDYHLMTTVPGLFALGECNFSDHGANRLGASALMQGLADGYFIIPYTLGHYLANHHIEDLSINDEAFQQAQSDVHEKTQRLLKLNGKQTVDDCHRKLGHIMWDYVGMSRNKSGLEKALHQIADLKEEFWNDVGLFPDEHCNTELEKAGRLLDFLDLGEMMAQDALERQESCGGHFREEYQTKEGEALRDDENFSHVAAWQYLGKDQKAKQHKEPLEFSHIKLTQRSYK